MIIKSVSLRDYRNIERLNISGFSEGKNIIVGENAQGKTNFVEAINYLSCAKSFRTVTEEQLIREGADEALLGCTYKRRDHSGKIEAKLSKDRKKIIKVNGMPISRIPELLGKINTVVFAPEDMRTLKESPGLRRRMIDVEISKIRPSYYVNLQRLAEVIKNKNLVLKQKVPDKTLLEVYNEAIVEYSSQIISYRSEYIERLSENARKNHSVLNAGEELVLRYRCCCDPGNIKETLIKKLSEAMAAECERGYSLIGPQREDVDIIINGKPAKLFGSQGQQRSAMIAIKLAVARLAYESTGEYPILLLDDVFSELDPKRTEALFYAIENMQVFITAAEYRENFGKETCFFMKNGKAEQS